MARLMVSARPACTCGSARGDIKEPQTIELPDGSKSYAGAAGALRQRSPPGAEEFDPCTILLNNDLSSGTPSILENLNEQMSAAAARRLTVRRKSNHFAAYDEVVKKFAVDRCRSVDAEPVFRQGRPGDFRGGRR